MKLRRDNTTGHVGVTYDTRRGTYRARAVVRGVTHHLGPFGSLARAVRARREVLSGAA